MTSWAEVKAGGHVVIVHSVESESEVVLASHEILELLKSSPKLGAKATRRGKDSKRAAAARRDGAR